MSGGTWNYDDARLQDLAETLREGRPRWSGEGGEPLGFPEARELVAQMLEVVGGLLHELDWHYSGDTVISDEADWVDSAKTTIRVVLDT